MDEESDTKKRPISDESSSDDDSDDEVFGPSLVPAKEVKDKPAMVKKRKKVVPDAVLTKNIPLADSYRFSYEQESMISAIASTSDGLIIVGLMNGAVKFYRKVEPAAKDEAEGQLEFLKQFMAHPNKPVNQLVVNKELLATLGENDNSIKIFDLASLDMIQVLNLEFVPGSGTTLATWFNSDKLVIPEKESKNVYIVDTETSEAKILESVHRFPITSLVYASKFQCFISCDTKGIIEYWDENGFLPKTVSFKFKSETDLFDIAKSKSKADELVLSPDQTHFVTISKPDEAIRIYRVETGKLVKKIDESASVYENDADKNLLHLHHEISANNFGSISNKSNIVFDENGKILIYPSLVGIKIINLQTMKLIATLGQQDCSDLILRFSKVLLLNKSSIQKFDSQMLASENSLIDSKLMRHPIIVATATNLNRLYEFSNQKESCTKDYNLKSTRESSTRAVPVAKSNSYSRATLHTTKGDIKIKFFPGLAPKTVENFTKLCEKKYYNNVIFHRVIKDMMIQTGDPLGDGTGGESAWGGYFKDEFNPLLTHNRPFMVSMANAGPNTNGSQFFITTEETPWLNNKHTIFGEVTDGMDTVKAIAEVETDERDAPMNQISILSTTLE